MRKKSHFFSKNTLYCFTPEVSLATFVIEIGFVLYTYLKFKATTFSRVCIGLLLCLGTFQAAEFMFCRSATPDIWPKIGYIATIFLPAFGMHMTSLLTNRAYKITYAAYMLALGITIMALLYPLHYFIASCNIHYVDMWNKPPFNYLHNIYYIVFIFCAVYVLIHTILHRKKRREIEVWLVISYAVFLIPTYALYFLRYIFHSAIPSVMCGFAIMTALIITLIILPMFYRAKKLEKK